MSIYEKIQEAVYNLQGKNEKYERMVLVLIFGPQKYVEFQKELLSRMSYIQYYPYNGQIHEIDIFGNVCVLSSRQKQSEDEIAIFGTDNTIIDLR